MTESAQRNWLLSTRLVQAEAHEVLGRKFPHLPQPQTMFDAIWSEATCVPDVDEPVDDNGVRLLRAAQVHMQILSPRDAWMRLFVQGGVN